VGGEGPGNKNKEKGKKLAHFPNLKIQTILREPMGRGGGEKVTVTVSIGKKSGTFGGKGTAHCGRRKKLGWSDPGKEGKVKRKYCLRKTKKKRCV